MMGPMPMGHTRDEKGLWEISYKMDAILEWGTTEYKQWFDEEVLTWAKTQSSSTPGTPIMRVEE